MNKWLDFEIKYYDEVDSTQLEARRKITEYHDAIPGQIICSAHQTAGYGKYKREWRSSSGDLAFSAMLKPAGDNTAQLCYVAALAVETTLKTLSSILPVKFKWVNDVLVNDFKIAGILLEKVEHDFIIMGIGLNLLPKETVAFKSTSLKELDIEISVSDLAQILASKLQYFYNLWLEKGFAPIRTQWLYQAKGLNKNITINIANKEKRQGIFLDLDEEGNLLLMENGNVNTVNLGEVFFDDTGN